MRTSLIDNLQGIISHNCGFQLPGETIKQVRVNHIVPLLASQKDLAMSGAVSKDCVDYRSRKIRAFEISIENNAEILKEFSDLQTVPGIGRILSLTIMWETGDTDCFAKIGNFSSYYRKGANHLDEQWQEKGQRQW